MNVFPILQLTHHCYCSCIIGFIDSTCILRIADFRFPLTNFSDAGMFWKRAHRYINIILQVTSIGWNSRDYTKKNTQHTTTTTTTTTTTKNSNGNVNRWNSMDCTKKNKKKTLHRKERFSRTGQSWFTLLRSCTIANTWFLLSGYLVWCTTWLLTNASSFSIFCISISLQAAHLLSSPRQASKTSSDCKKPWR